MQGSWQDDCLADNLPTCWRRASFGAQRKKPNGFGIGIPLGQFEQWSQGKGFLTKTQIDPFCVLAGKLTEELFSCFWCF